MTKILLLTTFSIFSIYVGAKTQVYECKALIRENKVVETFRFQFKCDNYGQGATFQSQSKRFTLMAFSEESCTPQLFIHDVKMKVATSSAASSQNDGFDVFKQRVVMASYQADISNLNDLFGADQKLDAAVIACSDNSKSLDDIQL